MPNKIQNRDFRVKPGADIDLSEWPTDIKPIYGSKDDYEALLKQHVEKLQQLQELQYANGRYALLIIFQGMDASGKDGAISHVMSGVNPQGCQVHSFKHPSTQELDHDFLWRTTRVLPLRGHIGIFNRSYYEEVLIVRVHPELLTAEQLPKDALKVKHFWHSRYRSILDLEHHLTRNGTQVVKFFLHVSKEEQRRRLLERIDDPKKHWKFSLADMQERALWDRYAEAYEHCLGATSTKQAPWYIVPADDKKNARLIISSVIQEILDNLKLELPQPDPKLRSAMKMLRSQLDNRGS
jgi:PPK2 family polyphosphate:nucleotide phosphotransferase